MKNLSMILVEDELIVRVDASVEFQILEGYFTFYT